MINIFLKLVFIPLSAIFSTGDGLFISLNTNGEIPLVLIMSKSVTKSLYMQNTFEEDK
jgi:hypothetical protein